MLPRAARIPLKLWSDERLGNDRRAAPDGQCERGPPAHRRIASQRRRFFLDIPEPPDTIQAVVPVVRCVCVRERTIPPPTLLRNADGVRRPGAVFAFPDGIRRGPRPSHQGSVATMDPKGDEIQPGRGPGPEDVRATPPPTRPAAERRRRRHALARSHVSFLRQLPDADRRRHRLRRPRQPPRRLGPAIRLHPVRAGPDHRGRPVGLPHRDHSPQLRRGQVGLRPRHGHRLLAPRPVRRRHLGSHAPVLRRQRQQGSGLLVPLPGQLHLLPGQRRLRVGHQPADGHAVSASQDPLAQHPPRRLARRPDPRRPDRPRVQLPRRRRRPHPVGVLDGDLPPPGADLRRHDGRPQLPALRGASGPASRWASCCWNSPRRSCCS